MSIRTLDSRPVGARILSIDFFRGVIMFLLIGSATGLYDQLVSLGLHGSIIRAIGLQFQHHPWQGLRAWDLGQPFFMFISGVAMVFSYERRWDRGESWKSTFGHALRRAILFFVIGWALGHINPIENGGPGEFLQDILPQLAVAGLLGFLTLRRTSAIQAGAAVGLLVLTEILYRLWPLPGAANAFVPGGNFGSRLDLALFGRLSEGNWVAFNVVPSTVFILAGILAGRLLKSGQSSSTILKALILCGSSLTSAGLILSFVTPVIRRICSSSFVLVSVGLGLLALALAYWLIDVAKLRIGAVFFLCVGMNPLFLYLFAMSGGGEWLRRLVEPFTMAFARWIGDDPAQVVTSASTWGLLWALGYWLYRKRIFIRI